MANRKVIYIVLGMLALGGALLYQRQYLENHPRIAATAVSLDTQNALTKLEQAVLQAPQDASRRWLLADAYQKAAELDKAAQQLQAIAALEPEKIESRMALANISVAQGNFSEAEQGYRASVQLAPKSVEAWQGLASALYHQKRCYESLEAARKAAILAPDDVNTHVILASAALDFAAQFPSPHKTKAAELNEAKRHFLEALKRLPREGNLYVRLGMTQLAQEDAAGALKTLQQAEKLMPDQKMPIILQARALMMNSQREKAKELVTTALTRFPDEAEFHSILSRLWRGSTEADGPQKSYEFIRRAVELEPQNADYQETLGLAALRVKKMDEAKTAFERALQLNPHSRVPYLQLSAIENQLGQAKSATNYAKKSAQTNANESELRKLENLTKAFPRDAAVRATLADWYVKRGFIAAARDTYIQALRLAPKNEKIKSQLAQVQKQLAENPL